MSADHEKDITTAAIVSPADKKPFKRKIVWFNTLGFLVLHIAAVYGLFLVLTAAKLLTVLWVPVLMVASSLGVVLGAHRMYTHKALKGTWQIRFILVALQTLAGQNCLYIWVRDHRQHHKYSDTDADPHNSKRGFFFSHIGWLCSRKHPDVIEKGKSIDMSDIEADSIAMFQKRHYKVLYVLIALYIPTAVPCYLWNETLWNSFFISFILRTILVLNFTWLVNSAAHAFGNRPFTKSIVPVDTGLVSALAMGEGWHNYHHTFPWDYRAAEFGQYFNATTSVIDFLSHYGWVYDLRAATPEMVINRIVKHGDGTHPRLDELTKKFQAMQQLETTQDRDNVDHILGSEQNELKFQKQRQKGSV